MAKTTMQKASLPERPVERIEREGVSGITKQVATLDGVSCKRVRFAPGGVTKGCMHPHVAYVISGALRVRMQDGSEDVYRAGDMMLLPPGHDVWTVGDEACEFVEFSQGTDGYYTPHKA
jgi:quercetin dioxygenase-like cupin family protein